LLSQRQSTRKMHSTKTEWNISYMRLSYIVLIWVTDRSGRPPLEDINAQILQVLEAEPWSSLWTIAELFKILASTVHLHLTTCLPIQVISYKCLMSRLLSISKWHLIKNLIEQYSC
jgi:hypothetical protein